MDLPQINQFLVKEINVGIIVIDAEAKVKFINQFVLSNTDLATDYQEQSLFNLFPELPEKWLKRKIESVFTLNTPAFTSWEQREYLFKMRHTRPITTENDYMAQNCTLLPMSNNADNQPELLGFIIEDATDVCFYQKQLSQTVEKLEISNRTDSLTKVANRRYWEERLAIEFERAKRHNQPLSLIMFDLDKFKNINDTFGHVAGDTVLIEVAQNVAQNLRQSDLLGRYGGEEFAIILPETDAEGALVLAERIRLGLAMHQIKVDEGTVIATLSLGVICICDDYSQYEEMITRADMALYQSKRDGRNRTTLYQA
ncbi:GGDEF domain-containing protein [Catenovulum sp. SM1970]|uniref:GGDEF domain-containing protein n=1 Tax=Marinifaba aquimaris TaxID=2741323 RepID=UPI00157414A8|nr:GGDEF domain-containing protein [Marinifaba aquimaris]NTS75474.1 GGDEF domain-containing protein [Marinifaba aquimaris]